MELEPVKPPHRALADFGHALEHLVGLDALVMADGNLGGVHETYAGARTKAYQTDEHKQGNDYPVLDLDEAAIR